MTLSARLGAGTALLCAALGASAQSYTLDFGRSADQPLVACTTASGVCGNFSRLSQSYGDVAGVVDVTTGSADGQALTWWSEDFNDLYGVAINNYFSAAAPAWVDLVPLAEGAAVNLSRFDLGGYLGQRHNVSVQVFDIGSGAELFSYIGSIGSRGNPAEPGNWGQPTEFRLALSSFSGLRIQWADPSVARNTAIDNISFSVGAPVPEPATGALLLTGLAGVGWVARRRRGLAASGLGLGLALFGAGAAHAAPTAYTLQLLSPMPGASHVPSVQGVNIGGVVAGRTDVGGDVLATVWAPGMPVRVVGQLPSDQRWAMATDINDLGTVVGYSASGDTATHAFRWSVIGGVMENLSDSIGGANSSAFAINNPGQVAGTASLGGPVAAVWQTDGSFTNLGHYERAGAPPLMSHAFDISDSGHVAAWTYFQDGGAQVWRWHALQGQVALPDLAGGTGHYFPNAVNEQGWTVGETWLGSSSSDVRAVMWSPSGDALALQGNGFYSSAALDINADGTVVGRGHGPGGARAFIWTAEHGMVDAASRVVNLGSFRLGEASAINQLGQIAGWGYDSATGLAQPYLLTPVPEPEALALWSAGLVLLGLVCGGRGHGSGSRRQHPSANQRVLTSPGDHAR